MRPGFERLMVGRTLAGRYEVLEPIGSGGMSLVFRGLDRTLGREVAVKVVSLAGAPDESVPNLRERFRREAASAAKIQHPNVVGIFDYGTDPDLELDFIVMELLRGRDLKEALTVKPPRPPEALRILMDAARGVAAGHRAGIVHRDIKPANVFLLGDEHDLQAVRVLDFGIAKPMEDGPEAALTTIGHLPHSPAYATPEHLDTERPVTAASDVYQLGLIGYEMLAGRRAFTEDERTRIRAGQHVPLPITDSWAAVPPGVCAVIHRALQPQPSDRYPDAAAFAEALAAGQARDAAHDDAATIAIAPPVPDPDSTALLSDPAGVPIVTPMPVAPSPAPEPVHARAPEPVPVMVPAGAARPPIPAGPAGVGVPTAARRSPVPRSAMLWGVPLLLLLAIAVWAARRGSGGADAPADMQATLDDTTQVAALDEEFLKMEGQVGRQAASRPAPAATPDGGSQLPPAAVPGATPAPVPGVSPVPPALPAGGADVLAQARTEIDSAVHRVNRAWVEGDMSEHIRHYGSRVDYYNSRNLPRAGVARDRRRDLRRYESRAIGIRSVQVQFQAPDQARVLVDKNWVFGGDGAVRRGQGIQEYIFKRDEDDGKWYITSEQLLTRSEAAQRD